MRNDGQTYLLDANVLITAHRTYYSFDLCPGFWAAIIHGFNDGILFSTERVRKELLCGKDVLTTWVTEKLPKQFFIDDSSSDVIKAFTPMMAWVVGRKFPAAAQAKFARDADGWLVAAAKTKGFRLVTHETRKPDAKAVVPLANVCDEFSVSYCNTFAMLKSLGVEFR
jgi:hypothetical protein